MLMTILLVAIKLWSNGPSCPLTFVDFTSLYKSLSSSSQLRPQDWIKIYLRDELQLWREDDDDADLILSQEKAEECIDNIELIDGETYRCRVGDDELWRLETDWSAFGCSPTL
jgi:hypothetical protein